MRLEKPRQLIGTLAPRRAPDPLVPRGEFRQPGEGRGQEELSAGLDQVRDAREENPRVGQAAEQIGGQHDIEGAEVRTQTHGIADFELHPRDIDPGRHAGRGPRGAVAFDGIVVTDRSLRAHLGRGRDKRLRVVDADDLSAVPGQLEARASDGAADIEGAGVASDGGRIEQVADAADGESEGLARPVLPRQDLVRLPVVEEQVFADQPLFLVDVAGQARGSC